MPATGLASTQNIGAIQRSLLGFQNNDRVRDFTKGNFQLAFVRFCRQLWVSLRFSLQLRLAVHKAMFSLQDRTKMKTAVKKCVGEYFYCNCQEWRKDEEEEDELKEWEYFSGRNHRYPGGEYYGTQYGHSCWVCWTGEMLVGRKMSGEAGRC